MHKRSAIRRRGTLAAIVLLVLLAAAQTPSEKVEQWGVFEVSLRGPEGGNPFLDVQFSADFKYKSRVVSPDGFYDGGGTYRARFMPDTPGVWTYTTRSNRPELDGKTGSFTCVKASPGNHGPVNVWNTWHFAYADGTPYFPVGTTCYAWAHQGDELEEQSLATLRSSPFNKLRMCVFPKHYAYNRNEPQYYPFPRNAGQNDYTRFNPEFFQHFEKRVKDLLDMGIEADLILFHGYDRWGYATMPAEVDDRYLRYTVARFAAFRNVWWSMANEWDLMKGKTMADWDRFFRVVQESDPYQHLRSIHNSGPMYDHGKPWVTHVSVQSSDFQKTTEWLAIFKKPVIYDECKYEGNIPLRWGNISAQEMVRRFWLATAQGAYAGHGETYLHPKDILWWSKGGVLHGQSAPRLAFLRKVLKEGPAEGLVPFPGKYLSAGVPGKYYLYYLDIHQPGEFELDLAPGVSYQVEILDPWEMTVTSVPGRFERKFTVKLPSKPYLALRIRKTA